jgi:hypothetical protein
MEGIDDNFDVNQKFYNSEKRWVRPLINYDLVNLKYCGVLDSEIEYLKQRELNQNIKK